MIDHISLSSQKKKKEKGQSMVVYFECPIKLGPPILCNSCDVVRTYYFIFYQQKIIIIHILFNLMGTFPL